MLAPYCQLHLKSSLGARLQLETIDIVWMKAEHTALFIIQVSELTQSAWMMFLQLATIEYFFGYQRTHLLRLIMKHPLYTPSELLLLVTILLEEYKGLIFIS